MGRGASKLSSSEVKELMAVTYCKLLLILLNTFENDNLY